MIPTTCPCGARTIPDPSCDMCDGWQNDPDTGWGGFHDGHLGKHFNSEEERQDFISSHQDCESDEED